MKRFFLLTFIVIICGCSNNPVAIFSYEINEDGEVTFTNSSENAKSFQWDYGDGSFDVLKDPTHKFEKNGTFDVKLTATNAKGAHSSVVTLKIDNIAEAPYVFWTKRSDILPLEIFIDGVLKGNVSKTSGSIPGCWTLNGFTVSLPPGAHKFKATGRRGYETKEFDIDFVKGLCKSLECQ